MYIDINELTALARRCRASAPVLPTGTDPQVRRFSQMARAVDPRVMLLDEEFDVNLRFAVFSAMMEPLGDLFASYTAFTDLARGRDERFLVYLDILLLTTRSLCAGVELLGELTLSWEGSPDLQRKLAAASSTYASEFSNLLGQTIRILEHPGLIRDGEARALRSVVEAAARALQRSAL